MISGNPSRTSRNRFFDPKVVPEEYLPSKRSVRGRRGPVATAIAPSFSPHTSHDHNFRCHCTPFAGTTDSSLILTPFDSRVKRTVLLPRSHFQLGMNILPEVSLEGRIEGKDLGLKVYSGRRRGSRELRVHLLPKRRAGTGLPQHEERGNKEIEKKKKNAKRARASLEFSSWLARIIFTRPRSAND